MDLRNLYLDILAITSAGSLGTKEGGLPNNLIRCYLTIVGSVPYLELGEG